MKRLLQVGGGTLVLAVILGLLLRSGISEPDGNEPAASTAGFEVQVDLTEEGIRPYRVRVPKDHEVRLIIRASPRAPEGMLSILGYEDRVPPIGIGPGQSREVVFESRLPGDDFAFSLGGEVIGRLEVTGDHLPEGHQ